MLEKDWKKHLKSACMLGKDCLKGIKAVCICYRKVKERHGALSCAPAICFLNIYLFSSFFILSWRSDMSFCCSRFTFCCSCSTLVKTATTSMGLIPFLSVVEEKRTGKNICPRIARINTNYTPPLLWRGDGGEVKYGRKGDRQETLPISFLNVFLLLLLLLRLSEAEAPLMT
jgi:hypothetical protein